MSLNVAIATDHGGFDLKQELLPWLKEQGYQVLDLGADVLNPLDDYPDYAIAVAEAVAGKRVARGIIICGSGVGAAIAAN